MQTDQGIRFEQRFEQHSDGVEIEWKAGSDWFEAVKNDLKRAGVSNGVKRNVVLGFRAQDVSVSESSDAMGFKARLTQVDRLGESTLLVASVGKDDNLEKENQADSEILVRHDAQTSLQVGDEVRLAVDPQRVVWFDPDTGKNFCLLYTSPSPRDRG